MKSITILADKLRKYSEWDYFTGCRNWTGCTSGGRGQVRWDGKMRLASRASAVVYNLKDPDGNVFDFDSRYLVLHKCNNPRCINPDPNHLYIGTNSQNMYDRQRAGRAPDLRGVKHPQCKLSENDVKTIRQLLKDKIPQREIARRFSVSQSQICYINTGKARREVS